MAGVTFFAYRKFMKPFGCDIVYSEMVSDCGLIYGNKETDKILYSDNSEFPYALQLFGGSKETICKAIDILEERQVKYDILDINLACPVPKVTKNNGGSARLKDPLLLEEMISMVVKKSKKPVSCKIRLGWDDSHINVEEICKILEKCGVEFIAIHARTTKQGYTGKARYEELKNIHNIIKIPFGISGDIFEVSDALTALEVTKANAVLVARGGIGNPLLLTNIRKAINNEHDYDKSNFKKQKEYLLEFTKMLIDEKGEKNAISILRGIAPKFFNDLPNGKQLKVQIATSMNNYDDLEQIVNKYIEDLEIRNNEINSVD